jgi:hypothetical protein
LHTDAIEEVDAFFKHDGPDCLVKIERAGIDPGIERDLVVCFRCLIDRYRVIAAVETEPLIDFAHAKGCAVLKCPVVTGNLVVGISIAAPPTDHSSRRGRAGATFPCTAGLIDGGDFTVSKRVIKNFDFVD